MKETKVKYLILGGGITGLGFANFLKNKDFLIIEKEKNVGGYCKTIYKKEYIWDYAGHFFHFKTKEIKEYFKNKVKDTDLVSAIKNTKIFYKEKKIDYPFQKNIHQLDKEEFIDCLYDLFEKKEKEKYESFIEMLYGKFGKSITDKFLKPYNEKLYACDLKFLDVDAMGRFFPYASKEEIIKNMKEKNNGSYNDTFIYPKRGAQFFIDMLEQKIKSNIRTSEEVIKIDSKRKIVVTNNYSIKYEYLVNTIPLNKFLELEDKNLYLQNKTIFTYNKVLVFNLGFNKEITDKIHWGYIPEKEVTFYRIGFYNNILNEKKLSMYIEIGYNYKEVLTEEKIQIELAKTLENLKKLKIIDLSYKLEEYMYIVMDPAYVHINSKILDFKYKLKQELKRKNVYTIGRYGDWKYCSMEDCLIDGLKLANELEGKVDS